MTIDERKHLVSCLNWALKNLRPNPPDRDFDGWTPLDLEAYEQNMVVCEALLCELEATDPPVKRSWFTEPRELGGMFVEIVPRDAEESVPMASVSVIPPSQSGAVVAAGVGVVWFGDDGNISTAAARIACGNCFAVDHTIDHCHWTAP